MPRDGAASRERIVNEGTRLFVRNGFHGTGIQEISDAVGLGRGALYHHIGSKENLLFTISMTLLRQAIAMAEPVATSTDLPEAKLRRLARDLLAHHAAHGESWAVVIREARFLTAAHRDEVNAARDEYEALWRGVLQAGAASGRWRPIDDVEVRGVLGMFNSAARWIRPDGPLRPDEIADRFIDLLEGGLQVR